MQEKWFKECRDNDKIPIYREGNKEYVIYKGFKLEHLNGRYKLLDVRFFDFYSRVSKRDKKILKRKGFVKGCDTIMYFRDIFRTDKYERDLEFRYEEKYRLEEILPRSKGERKRIITKKLGVLKRKIHESIDLLFFYNVRKEQFKIKYKK